LRVLITGVAGFIGSTLADRLLSLNHTVIGVDNFSTGQDGFLREASRNVRFDMRRIDLLDRERLDVAFEGVDLVVHLAANADVRFGLQHPGRDLEQNVIATWNVLEAMRKHGVKRIAFSSTGSVYGEPDVFPTPEKCPFPLQTSLYGASKLGAEGMIQAYCEGYGMQGYLFRFVSILGERYSHGHVFDFYKQLLEHPDRLSVLGDGHQKKSYLYVQDCVDAVLTAIEHAKGKLNIFNLGTDEYCEVNTSIGWICGALGVKPRLEYSGGKRGWTGDSPFILLDCSEIRSLGWKPKFTIREGVVRTVEYLQQNHWLLEGRALESCAKDSRAIYASRFVVPRLNPAQPVHPKPPMRPPCVSIIMLTYNRPQFIGRAIQSVVMQRFTDWELLIVQDGNQELTRKIVEGWKERESRLHYFRREEPGNVASALNFGIRQARGEFIAVLDDDDCWISQEKLAQQVAFLQDNPEYVACGGGAVVIDERGDERLRYLKPKDDAQIRAKILHANPMAHSTTLYRKSVAEKIGLYDEGLPGYQDWDFFLKMARHGKLQNFPEPMMYYTLWNGGTTYRRLRLNAKSAVRIVARHAKEFKGARAAKLLAYTYVAYTYLPAPLRSTTYSLLSRLKKWFFASRRTANSQAQGEVGRYNWGRMLGTNHGRGTGET
jgi:UDP-glucose 4-epimerase